MRTKTLALSALLGMIGSASLIAQTNVYSLNAVGYINVTLYPGWNIVTCPLIGSSGSTISNLFPNTNGQYQIGSGRFTTGSTILEYVNGTGYVGSDTASSTAANGSGWSSGGQFAITPGNAIWFFNPVAIGGSNMTATFVGTVPQVSTAISAQLPTGLTNTVFPGWNLMGSVVPTSGDLVTNSITSITTNLQFGPTSGDAILVFDPTYDASTSAQGGYSTGIGGDYSVNRSHVGSWNVDPTTVTPYEGFWYFSNSGSTNNWVENFTVNP
jgi:hypothetical protein